SRTPSSRRSFRASTRSCGGSLAARGTPRPEGGNADAVLDGANRGQGIGRPERGGPPGLGGVTPGSRGAPPVRAEPPPNPPVLAARREVITDAAFTVAAGSTTGAPDMSGARWRPGGQCRSRQSELPQEERQW